MIYKPIEVKERLRIAVEDRFIIVRLNEEKAILPEGNVLETIAETLGSFSSSYNILCDWRGLKDVTGDVVEVVRSLCYDHDARIIARPGDVGVIEDCFEAPILQVKNDFSRLNYSDIPLSPFKDEFDVPPVIPILSKDEEYQKNDLDEMEDIFNSLVEPPLIFEEERIPLIGAVEDTALQSLKGGANYRRGLLHELIQKIGRNSLLTEFVIQNNNDSILLTPYHSHAHYPIELNDQLVIGRPGVIARKTGAILESEIQGLEDLVNGPSVKEAKIQSFLEQHPNILRALGYNYTHIYSQVILQRDDGTSLRPDFILEPVGSEWCDILDIKLPDKPIVVGRRDRKTFSAAVQELAAQLREYAAYFEDARLSKRIEELYGIKCYRPRLIGIIGRSPRLANDRQLRRLETQYSDIQVLTFDQLLKIAKHRPLM